jgi:hypothetical protein
MDFTESKKPNRLYDLQFTTYCKTCSGLDWTPIVHVCVNYTCRLKINRGNIAFFQNGILLKPRSSSHNCGSLHNNRGAIAVVWHDRLFSATVYIKWCYLLILTKSSCPANTMEICLSISRYIHVNNKIDILCINSSCSLQVRVIQLLQTCIPYWLQILINDVTCILKTFKW